MPIKANPSGNRSYRNRKTSDSKLKANAKYSGESIFADKDAAKVESIRLRVPKGWGDVIKDYVKTSDKFTSVNQMLNYLILQEIPDIKDRVSSDNQDTEIEK